MEVTNKNCRLKLEIIPAVVYSCLISHKFGEYKNYSGLDEEELKEKSWDTN